MINALANPLRRRRDRDRRTNQSTTPIVLQAFATIGIVSVIGLIGVAAYGAVRQRSRVAASGGRGAYDWVIWENREHCSGFYWEVGEFNGLSREIVAQGCESTQQRALDLIGDVLPSTS